VMTPYIDQIFFIRSTINVNLSISSLSNCPSQQGPPVLPVSVSKNCHSNRCIKS
jgi:hypothetical protein